MLRCALLIAALGGCLYEEKDFSPITCNIVPPPTTAEVSSTITGVVVDAQTLEPIPAVSITLLTGDLTEINEPTVSAATGLYTDQLPLSGAPFSRVYLKADGAPAYVPTFLSNTHPITADIDIPYRLVSVENAGKLAQGTIGANTFPAGTSTVFVNVLGCDDMPLLGATVRTTPSRRVFYFDGPMPTKTLKVTGSLGVVMIPDLPPGEVTIDVSIAGDTFRSQTYQTVADSITQFSITP